ncbi:MAG TPA: MFS transporter [Anaerolineales bacterium]|nr:MFS transporter [Anaerolineales bacterium]HMX76049.1 MFS transporter [Anaerolineales bacterium]HMZ42951.1 MFS transporter [Anaerolineales bacterium]HNC88993.1 MFS transporter [Anaerolineales bacterium]HNF34709.1 MFS transporter [Anaerolineales bacterium]
MSKENSRYRWFVVVVFFFFMLLHQTDKLMIGSMQVDISKDFNLNNQQWGLINSGALIVATILYPIWGYLYDRYSRTKLLSLASFIWGATTWLNAIVKTFGGFLTTRASTGIDDSSYPGLYTLIADYFGPNLRGKIYGILQLAQPIGYLVGMILALMVAPAIGGWRSVFYITGSLGLVIAVLIYFGVREMPRGQAEPEFENMPEMQTFKFSWTEAREIFKKKTMWFVFLQGFAGVFPWNVITFFFFAYLEKERGYDANGILFTMAPVILILASGYFIGGALGDMAFKRSNKGRIVVSSIGVLLGALFMYLAITTPVDAKNQFFILMCLTAVFMPLSSANVIATVYDVTVPEVRSTAQAVEYFIENAGAAFAPILTGYIADLYDLKTAILIICTAAWLLCFVFYLGAIFTIDKDSHDLREQMAARAKSM